MWFVVLNSRTFSELYEFTGYIMDDIIRDKYIREMINMSRDNFLLHEWEKEKLDKLVKYERRKNALEEGVELNKYA